MLKNVKSYIIIKWRGEIVKKSRVLKIFTIIAIILILFLTIFNTISNADVPTTIDPGEWQPSNLQASDVDEVMNIGGIIVSIIRTVGLVVSVVVLIIIGIKYMTGTIEEKADYKSSMRPYLIGVFIFFALSQLLAIIIDLIPGLFG